MRYDSEPNPERYPFVFATPDAPELRELRERYGLEALVKDSENDLKKFAASALGCTRAGSTTA